MKPKLDITDTAISLAVSMAGIVFFLVTLAFAAEPAKTMLELYGDRERIQQAIKLLTEQVSKEKAEFDKGVPAKAHVAAVQGVIDKAKGEIDAMNQTYVKSKEVIDYNTKIKPLDDKINQARAQLQQVEKQILEQGTKHLKK